MTASADETRSALRSTYPGETGALNQIRLDVDSWLEAEGADRECRERAELVVSELASNAIDASPAVDLEVSLCRTADNTISIGIANEAIDARMPHRRDWRPDHPLQQRGRGLSIVDQLASRVDIETTVSEVRVTAHLPLVFPTSPAG